MKANEKGSATLIVFVTIMFLLIILGTALTTLAMKSKSQMVELETLKNSYDGDMATAYKNYNNV